MVNGNKNKKNSFYSIPGSDSGSEAAHNFLRYGLSGLWVTAGLLQAQPNMFTPDFYANYPSNIMESVLQSVADGQPHWLASTLKWGMHVWGLQPVLFNLGAILIQVSIGVLLLIRASSRLRRMTLWMSVGWGLIVWVFGEGMGGILTGSTYFDGSPGAVLLYVLTSVLLLLPANRWKTGYVHKLMRWGMAVFWLVMALLQALPSSGFWQGDQVMNQFANTATLPQPRMLAVPIQAFSLWAVHQGILPNLIFITLMLLMAVGFALPIHGRWFWVTAFLWLLWSWWFGQDFGGIFSGMGTDLNGSAVLILWTLSIWIAMRPGTGD